MTDSGENGEKQDSRDPKNIAILLLVFIAVIMLALLVKNCVTQVRNLLPIPRVLSSVKAQVMQIRMSTLSTLREMTLEISSPNINLNI